MLEPERFLGDSPKSSKEYQAYSHRISSGAFTEAFKLAIFLCAFKDSMKGLEVGLFAKSSSTRAADLDIVFGCQNLSMEDTVVSMFPVVLRNYLKTKADPLLLHVDLQKVSEYTPQEDKVLLFATEGLGIKAKEHKKGSRLLLYVRPLTGFLLGALIGAVAARACESSQSDTQVLSPTVQSREIPKIPSLIPQPLATRAFTVTPSSTVQPTGLPEDSSSRTPFPPSTPVREATLRPVRISDIPYVIPLAEGSSITETVARVLVEVGIEPDDLKVKRISYLIAKKALVAVKKKGWEGLEQGEKLDQELGVGFPIPFDDEVKAEIERLR